jgi:23S rRNA (guanine2445-N2)-methyltransferase / 23S rRNA (guanine2069-N7)-methyltransferase
MSSRRFFLTCPKGIESLLLDEVRQLGALSAKETVAGVHCEGPLQLGYRLCLWSRLANKVLMPIATLPATDADVMYRHVKEIDWNEHFDPDTTFAIDFSGGSKAINNSHFGALRVKDAVVDYFLDTCGERPNVDSKTPMLRINARLMHNQLTLSIDLAGESLHRRGYRRDGAAAPLKENLAAAILLRAGWPDVARNGGALLDPMCGSGTLLLEAALMCADIAPGLFRSRFGFMHWKGHDESLWEPLVAEADQRRYAGLERPQPEIRGYDANIKAIRAAEENIQGAGLETVVRVTCKELAQFAPPTHTDVKPGLVITNPPYGERLGEESALVHLYRHLAERLKSHFGGWKVGVFTGNPVLAKAMRLKVDKRYKLFNGAIACELQMYPLYAKLDTGSKDQHREGRDLVSDADLANREAKVQRKEKPKEIAATRPGELPMTEGALMFANRIRKNRKQLKSWLKQQNIQAYRLYDADMPEYAVAVDCYGDQWQVTEYLAPKSIDPAKAAERFADVQAGLPAALEVSPKQIVYKQRKRQKGKAQYEKLDTQSHAFEVIEAPVKALVNLHDYLDTGLFLDHRPVRRLLGQQAKGKRFLNLFCYTAVATLHAAVGGAKSTTSVDMSATYINWAKRNLALNGLSETRNEMIQADCLQWLDSESALQKKAPGNRYDLIFLDPPSFSNSKRMDDIFDVQRDQVDLIDKTMSLLADDGLLIFSNNLRTFKLESELLERYQVVDITAKTLDRDFKRNQRIHQCWEIRKKG